MKKKENNYILIEVEIYRCHVVITWEKDIDKIISFAKSHGVKLLSDDWKKDFVENVEGANGLCMELGDKNTDVLVWLKEKPKKLSQYGTLYHELFHAVDNISRTHAMNPYKETEARAYLFEFLFHKASVVLWK